VVAMDIAMPLLNGLEATRQIRKDFPNTSLLILSAHRDDAYFEQATALGAAGFLLKQHQHTSPLFISDVPRVAGESPRRFRRKATQPETSSPHGYAATVAP
jgi:DNA-binding NarL/FixJ family response regulator